MQLAENLPWTDFSSLPFVVTVFEDRYGEIREALVNMEKICRVREIMQKRLRCPVNGDERSFYRLCSDEYVPFSNANMLSLSKNLESSNSPSYPKGLRTIEETVIHGKSDKTIKGQELQSWFDSELTYSTIINRNHGQLF